MMKTINQNKELSAIVVVGERRDDVASLATAYWRSLESTGKDFELIFVIDGNKPDVVEALNVVRESGLGLKIVCLSRAFGESTALMGGFDESSGDIIVTLPAYHQVAPEAIPDLVAALTEHDMVVARREPRRGSRFERLRRQAFHWLIGSITRIRFNDLGCGARVMQRRVLAELRPYGDQHRFLAVLASSAGFRVIETAAAQSTEDNFRSGYRIREYLHRLLDIFTVFFLIRFTKKPLRFFGMIGGIISIIGGLVLTLIVFQRLFLGQALADRPALLLSSLLVVLGLQLFSLGLLGELIIFTHARSLKEYKVQRIIGGEAGNEGGSDHTDRDRTVA
jgi:glycosyltransferase involved in cell wall biosynthesis